MHEPIFTNVASQTCIDPMLIPETLHVNQDDKNESILGNSRPYAQHTNNDQLDEFDDGLNGDIFN